MSVHEAERVRIASATISQSVHRRVARINELILLYHILLLENTRKCDIAFLRKLTANHWWQVVKTNPSTSLELADVHTDKPNNRHACSTAFSLRKPVISSSSFRVVSPPR